MAATVVPADAFPQPWLLPVELPTLWSSVEQAFRDLTSRVATTAVAHRVVLTMTKVLVEEQPTLDCRMALGSRLPVVAVATVVGLVVPVVLAAA